MKILMFLFLFFGACISTNKTSGLEQERIERALNEIETNVRVPVVITNKRAKKYSIEDRMAEHQVPGISLAFIENNKVIFKKGYGVLEAGTTSAVTPKTLFQAASISKPVAALGVMLLVKENKLDLNANINDYLKSWKIEENEFYKDEKVSIRRLLSHFAGLSDQNGFAGYKLGAPLPGLTEILSGNSPKVNSAPVVVGAKPGSFFQYSGGGYEVLQLLIEDLSGQAFEDYMAEKILRPLEMTDSTYKYQNPKEAGIKVASAHNKNKVVMGKWHHYPEKAAASLWTNPSDLAKMIIAVYNCAYGNHSNSPLSKILSRDICKDLLKETKLPLKKGGTRSVGLGFQVAAKPFGKEFHHSGGNEGITCNFRGQISQDKLFGTIVMTNSDRGFHVIDEIEKTFDEVFDLIPHRPIKRTIAQIQLEKLQESVGATYKNEKMTITVVESNGQLALISSRDNPPDPLYIFPKSETEFFDLMGGLHRFNESEYIWTTPGDYAENIIFKKLTI